MVGKLVTMSESIIYSGKVKGSSRLAVTRPRAMASERVLTFPA